MEEIGMGKCSFDYLIGFQCTTWGLDGDNLGSDEAETVHIGWVVVEAESGKVAAAHHSLVCPQDASKVNWDFLVNRGVHEGDLLAAPGLDEVLQQFEAYVATKLPPQGPQQPNFILVTDGQAPLRQLLHPEATKKGINLSSCYSYFFDVRKEFGRLLNNNENLNSLQDIMKLCEIEPNASDGPLTGQCYDLGTVIGKLVTESKEKGLICLRQPDYIKLALEHGICTREDMIDGNTVIRARGLPWQSSDQDVASFFVGLNIAKGGVALCLSQQGRRNGEALVRFENQEHRDFALKRHRHFMGNRYIEVYRATGDDFISIAAGTNKEAEEFLYKTEAINIRMRGLPYDCTKEQITKFFSEGENGVEVLDGEKGVMFVMKADGKASGDAFVQFATKEDADKALLKNKETIGTRYIELFHCTPAEVTQVCSRTMDSMKSDTNGLSVTPTSLMGVLPGTGGAAGLQSLTPSALLPQQLMMGSSRKDCIRLRGLQYEAKVEHILDFLGEFAKHIVFQGVHMIFNAQGHPSGEAFIQMDSEQAAAMAAADRHNKYMQIPGKKQRYIEVFQCSADDMNLVLTGPTGGTGVLPSALFPGMTAAQTRPMLSPGGTFLHAHQQALAAAAFIPGFSQPAFFSAQVPGTLQNGQLAAAQAALAANGGMDALAGLRLLHGVARLPFIPGAGFVPTIGTPTGGPGGNTVVYFPSSSPPISPTSYYAAAAQMQQPGPGVVLMRGLPFNVTVTDVLGLLQGCTEITSDCVHVHRTATGQPTGEAFVTFPTRADAERAVVEKRSTLANRQIELYVCGI